MSNLLNNAKDVIGYLGQIKGAHPFSQDQQYEVYEIDYGYVNKVFIIVSVDVNPSSYILKQTWPYFRREGPEWPLSPKRYYIELNSLLFYNQIVPHLAPRVIYHDDEFQILIMEHLQKYVVLSEFLDTCRTIPNFAEDLSTFLSRTLFFTSDNFLCSHDKKKLQVKFNNLSIETISETLVFTNPFMSSPQNRWNSNITKLVEQVRSDSELKIEIARLKAKFINSPQALLHGDLHQDSIMVGSDGIKIIDPEFAFIGPMGYDVGLIFCTFIIAYLSTFSASETHRKYGADYRKYLITTMVQIWDKFTAKFLDLWSDYAKGHLTPEQYWNYPGGESAYIEYKTRYINHIMQDAFGFAGCRTLAGIMGYITFHNLHDIDDIFYRTQIERTALKIGKRLVLLRDSMGSIEDLISVIKTEAACLEKSKNAI